MEGFIVAALLVGGLLAFFFVSGRAKSQPPPPVKKEEPTPRRIDTSGALKDMETAHSYLHDWYNDKPGPTLAHAARYVEAARLKDPNVKFTFEHKGNEITQTADEKAAEILFCDASSLYKPNNPPEVLEKAAKALVNAIKYDPHSFRSYDKLVDVYLDLHEKQKAAAVAADAKAVFHDNIPSRKLADRIGVEAIAPPVLEPPSVHTGFGYMALGWVLLVIGGITAFFRFAAFVDTAGGTIALIIAGAGGVLILVGKSKESSAYFLRAVANQVNEQEREKLG